jgi:hypothetical protein
MCTFVLFTWLFSAANLFRWCYFWQCTSQPCRNGATCFDEQNGFTCTCPAGYSGVTCATDINEVDRCTSCFPCLVRFAIFFD